MIGNHNLRPFDGKFSDNNKTPLFTTKLTLDENNNGASGASGVEGTEESDRLDFDYEELKQLFIDKGANALLARLEELANAGIVTDIEVETESNKTTIVCKCGAIKYTFKSAKGDDGIPDTPDTPDKPDVKHADKQYGIDDLLKASTTVTAKIEVADKEEDKTLNEIKKVLDYFNKYDQRYINLGLAMLIKLDIPYEKTATSSYNGNNNYTITFSYNNEKYEFSYSDIEVTYNMFSKEPEDMPEEIVNDILTLLKSNDRDSLVKAMRMIRVLGLKCDFNDNMITFTYNGKEYQASVPAYIYFGVDNYTHSTEEGKFKSYADLRNYMYGEELNNLLKASKIERDYAIISSIVAKHEKDYASVTKDQLFREYILAYNINQDFDIGSGNSTNSTTPTTPPTTLPSGYKNWEELWESIVSGEIRGAVAAQVTLGLMKLYYETARNQLYSEFRKNCDTLTKDGIISLLAFKVRDLAAKDDAYDFPKDTTSENSAWYTEAAGLIYDIRGTIVENAKDTDKKITNSTDIEHNKIFENMLTDIIRCLNKENKEILKNIGGEAVLKALLKSAWRSCVTADTMVTEDFIKNVRDKLIEMLENIAKDSRLKDIYTADSTDIGTSGIPSTQIALFGVKYDDGRYHFDNDNQDKEFQKQATNVLSKLYEKYPAVSKSKIDDWFNQALLNVVNGCWNTSKYPVEAKNWQINLNDLFKNILWEFDKIAASQSSSNGLDEKGPNEAKPRNPKSKYDQTKLDDIKNSMGDIIGAYTNTLKDDISRACWMSIKNDTIHTEFGMDKDGKIVFQEPETTTIYQELVKQIKDRLRAQLGKLATAAGIGFDELVERLVQTAWISAYNDFNSSQKNNTEQFINKVLDNLGNMFKALQNNPKCLEVFTQKPAYANSDITSGVEHYGTDTTAGGDQVIKYSKPDVWDDGSVHISNTTDDNDYQTTMNSLLEKLIAKYPSLDVETITKVFRSAQKKALEICMNRTNDCPYGTGNSSHYVEDNKKVWGGKNNRDNRDKDDHKITMKELVQLTLYCFDKLIYSELL